MQYSQQNKNNGAPQKLGNHGQGVPRMLSVYERSRPSLRSKGTTNLHKSIHSGSSSSYKTYAANPRSSTAFTTGASPSSSSSNTMCAPVLKNAVSCSSCSSDDSCSEIDITETSGWSSRASSSGGNTSFASNSKEERLLSFGQTKRHRIDAFNSCEHVTPQPGRGCAASSWGPRPERHGKEILQATCNCPLSSAPAHSVTNSRSTMMESLNKRTKGGDSLARTSVRGNKFINQSSQLAGNATGKLESKGKSGAHAFPPTRFGPSNLHVAESKNVNTSSVHGSGSSQQNVSGLKSRNSTPSSVDCINGVKTIFPKGRACTESDTKMQCSASGCAGAPSSSLHRHRGNRAITPRARNNLGLSSGSNPNFVIPNNMRSSMCSSNGPQVIRVDGDFSSRNRDNQPESNSALRSEERRITSSGSPPSRSPPLPYSGSASNAARNTFNNPSSITGALSTGNSSHNSSLSTAGSSLIDRGQDRPNLGPGGSNNHRLHSLQVHNIADIHSHLTVEGLSEVISVLERIERDDDLTYEQILMLEATVLLGGLALNDRHRDMRLDVDNMSYEELLALEERIGDVKMGLSEETMLKCVKRKKYTAPVTSFSYRTDDVQIKCCICQEEFEARVELGLLDCGHGFHLTCIKQWLQQKNQCPICKAPAFS